MYKTPDQYAAAARRAQEGGYNEDAHILAIASIRARAEWVTLNGRWVPRTNIMRDNT